MRQAAVEDESTIYCRKNAAQLFKVSGDSNAFSTATLGSVSLLASFPKHKRTLASTFPLLSFHSFNAVSITSFANFRVSSEVPAGSALSKTSSIRNGSGSETADDPFALAAGLSCWFRFFSRTTCVNLLTLVATSEL
ncbi:hypothetical protein M758_7G133800 [Ceratodon purpureus]|nr:hypothetical protein M758_7G133800 [Ceratodon purpureus]